MNNGWIKIHRSITEWEWYKDGVVLTVFIDLLLKANHEPRRWQGIVIEKGQLVTSVESIFNSLNRDRITGKLNRKNSRVTTQNIRTALNKLKSTNEITIKTTNKYSIITINNWDKYQDTNKPTNKQLTNNQQTTNKQLTTNKNYKNIKKEDNIIFNKLNIGNGESEPSGKSNHESIPSEQGQSDTVTLPEERLHGNTVTLVHANTVSLEEPQNEGVVTGQTVNEALGRFADINPSYKNFFKNKTQRSAIERMLKEHGQSKVKLLIDAVAACSGEQFAPNITTPLQLEQKMGSLINYYKRKQNDDRNPSQIFKIS